jgi:hypothetical protein
MMPGSDTSAGESKRSKLAPESDAAHAVQRINLQLILQHVGPGDWFYMAGVSRRWQQLYRQLCEEHAQQQKTWVWRDGKRSSVPPVEPTATHYTRAFASLASLQLACSFDLALDSVKCLPLQAGRAADQRTLLWARKQGLPWCEALCEGAAAVGRLHMLKWLHCEQQCPWDVAQVIYKGMNRCDLPMLQELSRLASSDDMHTFCTEYLRELVDCPLAGCITALTWLHNAGCVDLNEPYNQQLIADAAIVGGHVSTLQWLLSKQYEFTEDLITYGNDELLPSSIAVRNGHMGVLEHFHRLGYGFANNVRSEAARSGSVEMMR